MTYNPPTSFSDIAGRLIHVSQQIRKAVDTLGYPEDDVRCHALMACGGYIEVSIIVLNILAALESGLIPYEQQRAVLGLMRGSVPSHVNKIAHFLRFSSTTALVFSIENLLVNILAAKKSTKKLRRGYSKIVTALLDEITITDKERKVGILNTLANIRNSLHSNGIHNNNDFEITIEGYKFTFKKGTPVNCAGWGQIIIALKAVIPVLVEILDCKDVRSLPTPIPIAYIEKF